tara:strand:+ start:286 stop:900 length:615 start_codon:yes stop_codon:yes gene_type:complete
MKLSNRQLKRIIQEELRSVLKEEAFQIPLPFDNVKRDYKPVADYCVGMSVNADLQWAKGRDIEFLKTKNVDIMKALLKSFAGDEQIGKMKIVDDKVQEYGDHNPEFGFTYYVTLGQSHMAVHTWPEMYLMNIDIFTCGEEGDPKAIFKKVVEALKPNRVRKNEFARSKGMDWKNISDNNKDPDAEGRENQLKDFYDHPFMAPCN